MSAVVQALDDILKEYDLDDQHSLKGRLLAWHNIYSHSSHQKISREQADDICRIGTHIAIEPAEAIRIALSEVIGIEDEGKAKIEPLNFTNPPTEPTEFERMSLKEKKEVLRKEESQPPKIEPINFMVDCAKENAYEIYELGKKLNELIQAVNKLTGGKE
jgi:hypothetical protein